MGNMSPAFPPVRGPATAGDFAKVRTGSMTPAFPSARGRPANTSDTGKIRIGNMSPAFPLMRPLVRGRPITISDSGEVQIEDYTAPHSSGSDELNVRIAAVSPAFAPVRSR